MTTDVRADELVEVTSYAEVLEAFRASPRLAVVLDEDSAHIRGGTVLRIDGDAHAKRRKMLNRLVFRDRHAWFRERSLLPALDAELAGLRARAGADGAVRVDLVELSLRPLIALVAAMIGLDGAGVDDLVALHAQLEAFPRLQTQLRRAAPPVPGGDEGRADALARLERGKREFGERFFAPALERRRALVARAMAGELAESELPLDFLTLVATHVDAALDADTDLPLRHAIIDLLHAGTGTSVGAVVHTVDELRRWVADHPEDAARLTDPSFLAGAVNETLRLHSANPAEVRRATEDVALSGGTTIRAGVYAALRTGIANRDVSVFGPDAGRFDPHRRVPAGVYAHGLAFGSGPHMCFGLPLAMGNDGADGNIVRLVRRFHETGVRPDPERRARYRPGIAHADLRNFDSYPVLLAP